MRIVEPSYEIMTPIDAEGRKRIYETIEHAARTCYKSEDKITEGSAAKMISALVRSNHEAMLEHAGITVKFVVDRGISHELVRHRVASFAQASTRYVAYDKDKFGSEITYIDLQSAVEYDESLKNMNAETRIKVLAEWMKACEEAERHYMKMRELGCSAQMARSVLNNSTQTEIVITANIREWRHILKLRAIGTTGAPHPQMKQIMDKLLKEFAEAMPELFGDLIKE